MDPPRVEQGTARWAVLDALCTTELQSQWTAPQVAVMTNLGLGTVLKALSWLRTNQLADLKAFIGADSLYEANAAGVAARNAGAQLELDVS